MELAIRLLQDPESSVRVRAVKVLHALTGQKFTSYQAAENWWKENKTNLIVHPQLK